MNDKKKLRGHAVKGTPNVSSTKYPSFKNKFIEKENCILHANVKENDTSNKNIESQRCESLYNHKSKRRVAKQTSTSKLKLFKKKTSILSPVENICSEKLLNTNKKSTEISLNLKNLPIYKRNLHLLNPSKKRRSVDVYDITLEEELASDVTKVKKKRIHSTKIKVKENRKQHLNSNRHLKSKKKKLLNSKSVDRKSALSIDKISTKKQGPLETDELVDSQILLLDQNKFNNEVCIEQNSFSVSSPNDTIESIQCTLTDLQSSKHEDKNKMYLSNLAEAFEKSFSVPKMTSTPDGIHSKTEILAQKNKNKVISVADISNIPACSRNSTIMISTPDSVHSKSEVQTQKNIIINIPDISDVPSNKNCTNSNLPTVDFLDNDVSPQTDKKYEDISLFESPKKSKTIEKNHPKGVSSQKTVQINLFGEVLQTPSSSSSAESLEESVIMPQKAYHTPDNFKRHLIRTKGPGGKTKKEPKKSKQDLLIEKLSKHFEEIGNTELCIE